MKILVEIKNFSRTSIQIGTAEIYNKGSEFVTVYLAFRYEGITPHQPKVSFRFKNFLRPEVTEAVFLPCSTFIFNRESYRIKIGQIYILTSKEERLEQDLKTNELIIFHEKKRATTPHQRK